MDEFLGLRWVYGGMVVRQGLVVVQGGLDEGLKVEGWWKFGWEAAAKDGCVCE